MFNCKMSKIFSILIVFIVVFGLLMFGFIVLIVILDICVILYW